MIPESYINQRTEEILDDPHLRPLIAVANQVSMSDLDFYLAHEALTVRENLKAYLKGEPC